MDLTTKTIEGFGRQWVRFRENPGYYGSLDEMQDICGPLLPMEAIQGRKVAEIGSGTGRIVNILLDAGADEVVALEPSEAFEVLQQNTSERADRVRCLRMRGEELPAHGELDFVFSIGVIHHIPDPAPVMAAARRALKPGGKMLVWLYGREGNEAYLRLALPLRKATVHLKPGALNILAHLLNLTLDLYMLLCRFLPLPLRSYLKNELGRCTRKVRHLTIFDQLNPAYAKYYREHEARALFEDAGFVDIQVYHRHGYSWTVIGTSDGGED